MFSSSLNIGTTSDSERLGGTAPIIQARRTGGEVFRPLGGMGGTPPAARES